MSGRHSLLVAGGVLAGALAVFAAATTQAADAPPQITGPVAAPDVPGAPTHNYIFFASNHELAAHGYVEEEYFIKGTASTYGLKDGQTASVKDGGHPFVTRIVVRRPADPKRFNGTAIVEWDNVTNMFDAENVWFFDWEDMMRAGYVWVGVSPQTIGVDALKKWNANRYGTLDVGSILAGTNGTGAGTPTGIVTGAPDADALSFDIFSQVGQALRHPGAADPLHGLKPKLFLAAGESQSARRLGMYVNSVHPLARVYDGFLLLSAVGFKIRPDLVSPVIKLSTEHDVVTGDAAAPQPDTGKFRAWEIAGTSHVDQHLRMSREALELRDNGKSLEAAMAPTCSVPSVGTRVPTSYVVASAFEKLARWAAGGPPPPTAPRLTVVKPVPQPGQSVIARNEDNLAEGGIQLAELAVPTQVNFGVGAPSKAAQTAGIQGEAIGPGACVRWGYSTDFTVDQLNAHYPSHAAYVADVRRVTEANLKHGYILAPDAAATISAAEASRVGEH